MARKTKALTDKEHAINMTPMIDIVFQMIIFFVMTVQLEKDAVNEKVRLADAPHGPAVEEKDSRTVTIDVDQKGRVSIARVPMGLGQLRGVMRNAVLTHGQGVPVVIRGDIQTKHSAIKNVMDTCTAAGLWKVKFSAIKDRAK